MFGSRDRPQNKLLAALTPAECERIFRDLRLAPLRLGQILHEPGAHLSHVYFPENCIVSLQCTLQDGASAELFMGGQTMTGRAVVQNAGYAYRLNGQTLTEEFHVNRRLQFMLLRYTQLLITQMAQTAVCNRLHSVEQQLCRRLLLSLDRSDSNQLTTTQGLIAGLLGVRREGINEAAGKLQDLGVIRTQRGRITVLDRGRLEQLCCECYAVIKKESDRLMPVVPSPAGP
jgi:hypothetical protein